MGGIQSLQIIFLLLLFFAVAFAALAERLKIPYPIILVIAGLLLGFAPGIPRIDLDPDVVFYVFLPPLLYAAAWNTSWREFSFNLVSILMLAIGLVAFTVVGVALSAHSLFPGFDWRSGAVLGAVVAATDAIAATSIANRLGVERRIVDVLEGESLVNDATALLALESAIALSVSGQSLSLGEGFLRFGYLSAAGIVTGIVVGAVVSWFEPRIDNGPIEIAISIFVAYASYFAAEAIHASGVLAVVVTGLYLSRRSVRLFTPGVRMQATAVWQALTFILNALVFLLIGLQLPYVLRGIRDYDIRTLILFGAVFAALIIALRLVLVIPGGQIAYLIRTRLLHQNYPRPTARAMLVLGWAGLRGVVALAAALSLPASFPNRDLIIFLTFSVILATLVVQGLTLPVLIRALGIARSEGPDAEEMNARRSILEHALRHLEQIRDRDSERFADVYDDVAQHYRTRLDALLGEGSDEHGTSAEHARLYAEISRQLLRLERETAEKFRNEGRIRDEALREILHELDLSETRIDKSASGQPPE